MVCRKVPQKWKPSILTWCWHGTPRMLSGADHHPMGRARDLHRLSRALEALSNCCMASCTIEKSATEVMKTLTSSAYATTETGSKPHPIHTPGRRCFNMVRKGWRHIVNKAILSGHPWRTLRHIGNGPYRWPLICTKEVASVYRFWAVNKYIKYQYQ